MKVKSADRGPTDGTKTVQVQNMSSFFEKHLNLGRLKSEEKWKLQLHAVLSWDGVWILGLKAEPRSTKTVILISWQTWDFPVKEFRHGSWKIYWPRPRKAMYWTHTFYESEKFPKNYLGCGPALMVRSRFKSTKFWTLWIWCIPDDGKRLDGRHQCPSGFSLREGLNKTPVGTFKFTGTNKTVYKI